MAKADEKRKGEKEILRVLFKRIFFVILLYFNHIYKPPILKCKIY